MYFYQLNVGVEISWASLKAYKFGKLFLIYNQSRKKFKSNFLRVRPNPKC